MIAPLDLQQALGELLGDAQLVACELPHTDLKLWLIDGDNMDRAFSPEETRRILHEPPYWSFAGPVGWRSPVISLNSLSGSKASGCWISVLVPGWRGLRR